MSRPFVTLNVRELWYTSAVKKQLHQIDILQLHNKKNTTTKGALRVAKLASMRFERGRERERIRRELTKGRYEKRK